MAITSFEKRKGDSRSGIVLVWVLVSLAAILAILALNLDGGRLMEERRRAQAVADAAALAGGADLYANYWTNHGQDTGGAALRAAQASATSNGYPASSISLNVPPTSGTFAGQAGYAEAVVTTSLSASFGRVFTGENLQVKARSVARGQPMKLGLIMLRSTGADAFVNQSPALTVVNSPIIVNSSAAGAFDQASFGVVVAKRYDIVGGFSNPGGALMLGKISTGLRPTPDPLAFLPTPSATGATVRSTAPWTVNSILPVTLQPGVYQGGLHITGVTVVVMQPGVYIMQGGGFIIDGAATVTGLNVVIYNTTSATYSTGPIQVSGLGKVVLTAPLSGPYQGINFFQARNLTNTVSVTGLGVCAIAGVVYAAKAPALLSGGVAAGINILGGAYVVDSMKIQGLGSINIDLGLNPPRVPDVRLVE